MPDDHGVDQPGDKSSDAEAAHSQTPEQDQVFQIPGLSTVQNAAVNDHVAWATTPAGAKRYFSGTTTRQTAFSVGNTVIFHAPDGKAHFWRTGTNEVRVAGWSIEVNAEGVTDYCITRLPDPDNPEAELRKGCQPMLLQTIQIAERVQGDPFKLASGRAGAVLPAAPEFSLAELAAKVPGVGRLTALETLSKLRGE